MEIRDLSLEDNKEYWLCRINESDWSAGEFLCRILREGKLEELCGKGSHVLLLTEGNELASFCTLAVYDDIQPTLLTPWIGFVYTFPKFRGRGLAGKLISYAENIAASDGAEYVYISTTHTGLYEKFGYEFYEILKDVNGKDSRVYRKRTKNAS